MFNGAINHKVTFYNILCPIEKKRYVAALSTAMKDDTQTRRRHSTPTPNYPIYCKVSWN